MAYTVDLTSVPLKCIYPLGDRFCGKNPAGQTLGFTNYYMTRDGSPFFGISGEIQPCRVAEDEWEDTLIKAKMGGLNIVAFYIFWNVHEEIRGKFRFDGNRNIRKFLELCHKHDLQAIVRIGPFCHGEMRNGGLPDWLYGMPFEVRSNDEGYLKCVRAFFRQLHRQFDGLYYSQGGPIIAAQIENEYMHAGAPWEMTTGISNEWITGGTGQETHMRLLKQIAVEEGIITPFYTCTGWGGAMAPADEMLPLWGGYGYWPWHFNGDATEHPLTQEFLYLDVHNDRAGEMYNFDPVYPPESLPFACCEMMGGMFNSYRYRFILDCASVDAMANTKVASGCNFVGYFMYRGGTNPVGEKTAYLHEHYTPKRSYDFQAVIRESGGVRESYFRLKLINAFFTAFTPQLIETKTILPEHMYGLAPQDTTHLRFALRIKGDRGFVFLNNFQDHFALPDIKNESITLRLPTGDLTIKDISLCNGENAILPFHLDLCGAMLNSATAQPITTMEADMPCAFFFMPEGMKPVYRFDRNTAISAEGCPAWIEGEDLVCAPDQKHSSSFVLTTGAGPIRIINFTRCDAMGFTKLQIRGKEYAFLSDGVLLWDGTSLKIESEAQAETIMAFPGDVLEHCPGEPVSWDIFTGKVMTRRAYSLPVTARSVGRSRYILEMDPDQLNGHKRVELHIDYAGDIGKLFLDGELMADHFCNGDTWITRVDPWADAMRQTPLTLYLVPIRKNAVVNADSAMAARFESAEGYDAALDQVKLVVVDDWQIL